MQVGRQRKYGCALQATGVVVEVSLVTEVVTVMTSGVHVSFLHRTAIAWGLWRSTWPSDSVDESTAAWSCWVEPWEGVETEITSGKTTRPPLGIPLGKYWFKLGHSSMVLLPERTTSISACMGLFIGARAADWLCHLSVPCESVISGEPIVEALFDFIREPEVKGLASGWLRRKNRRTGGWRLRGTDEQGVGPKNRRRNRRSVGRQIWRRHQQRGRGRARRQARRQVWRRG